VVAPSANLSKHVSPTSAQHVFEDFNGKIPLILDGGECVGGIESTVCDCTGEVPVVLRPGLVTREMIASVVGDCLEYTPDFSTGEKVKSPGLLYKHYAPRCKTILYAFEELQQALAQAKREKENARVVALCESALIQEFENEGVTTLNLGASEEEMAAKLYGLLREAEKIADLLIAIAPRKTDGIMTGVQNRLKKACASVDIKH
jgi:L-threonylcarbamoyladenylate synthase